MLTLRRNSETLVSRAQGSEMRSIRSVEQTRLSYLGLRRGSHASAEKRRGPRVADCRVFLWHLRNADFMNLAFYRRDTGLVSLRRDVDLALLNITSVRWSLRNVSSWALHFGIQTQTSRVWSGSEETQAWASHLVSARQMIFLASCICCRHARLLCRCLAFWLWFTGCWKPPVTWNWGRKGAWQDWPSTMLASRVS